MNLLPIHLLEAATTVAIPFWLSTLITLILSTAITGIIGYIVTRYLNRYFAKKDKAEKDLQQKLSELREHKVADQREQRKEDMTEIVKAELMPINEKLSELSDKITKTEDGTLSSLRNDILTCYYRCCEKGYRGDWDFENIHHLFDAYAELNGNSFVRDVMSRFDELPSKEEYLKGKRSKKNVITHKIESSSEIYNNEDQF